jgi:hypothetical protein
MNANRNRTYRLILVCMAVAILGLVILTAVILCLN